MGKELGPGVVTGVSSVQCCKNLSRRVPHDPGRGELGNFLHNSSKLQRLLVAEVGLRFRKLHAKLEENSQTLEPKPISHDKNQNSEGKKEDNRICKHLSKGSHPCIFCFHLVFDSALDSVLDLPAN